MSFSPSELHVIAVVSNPLRTLVRPRLAARFIHHMVESGVQLTVVEAALGYRPYELELLCPEPISFIGVRHSTLVWHKESLINIALSRLPKTARYIAWIDADVFFRNPNWASDTIHALQQYSIVQPWENCYDLGPHGKHMEPVHTSFASLVVRGQPIFPHWKKGYTFGHPGYAWAARREILEEIGGLFEFAALGSADHNMALGLLGRITETFPADISPEFTAAMLAWQARGEYHVGARIGYVPGTIEHTWHGSKTKRGYVSRWEILRQYNFNPVTDLRKNLDGVIELSGAKRNMRHAVEAYFRSRDEDANVM